MRRKLIPTLFGCSLLAATGLAQAEHTETVIGAAIGSAAGAAIGQRGDNNVVIWSALGGATGAYVGHSLGQRHQETVVVRERVRYVPVERHVVVHRPTYVVYEEPRYYKVKYKKSKHHRHHRDDWDDDD